MSTCSTSPRSWLAVQLKVQTLLDDISVLFLDLANLLGTLVHLDLLGHRPAILVGLRCRRGTVTAQTRVLEVRRLLPAACRTTKRLTWSRTPSDI